MSLEAKLHVDGELIETARWPTEFTTRRFYLVLALRARRGTPRGRSAATEPNGVGAQVGLKAVVLYGAETAAN